MDDMRTDPNQVAWRVKDWANKVGLSISYTHKMIGVGKIKSVRVGHTRLVTTSPREFIDQLASAEGDDVVPSGDGRELDE